MQIWKKETLDEIRSCATEDEADEIVLKFIETIEKEAEERMKEKCKMLILTNKQREVYTYFEEYKNTYGNYPTYGQSSKHFGKDTRQNIFISLRNARNKIQSISSL